MAPVSAAYLKLAGRSKADLAAVFASGSPPEVSALTGFEFRGYNQPKAAALLGIRKFIKAFYLDRSGQPFGCNTPVAQNGLASGVARPAQRRAAQTIRLLSGRTTGPRRLRRAAPRRSAPRLRPGRQPGLRRSPHIAGLPGPRRTRLGRTPARQGLLRRRGDTPRPRVLPHRALPATCRCGSARRTLASPGLPPSHRAPSQLWRNREIGRRAAALTLSAVRAPSRRSGRGHGGQGSRASSLCVYCGDGSPTAGAVGERGRRLQAASLLLSPPSFSGCASLRM